MYGNVNMITCGSVNCYVIRGRGGDILIDTGIKEYRGNIEAWLINYNIRLIVLTHGHNDHIENAAYLSEQFGAKILMSKEDVPLVDNNLCRKFYTSGALGRIVGNLSKRSMSGYAKMFVPDIYAADGMEIGAGAKIVTLGGHTRGSVGVLHGENLYIGDAAMNFIFPSFPCICESPAEARKSLDKVRLLHPERIFFGHGKPLECDKQALLYNNLFSRIQLI